MSSLGYGAESDVFNTQVPLPALIEENQPSDVAVLAVPVSMDVFEDLRADSYVSGAQDGLGFQQPVVVSAPASAPLQRSMHVKPGETICRLCARHCGCHSALMMHMRTHTGEKPYVCSYEGCDKAFAIRGNLKKHMRKVHERGDSMASGFLSREQVEDNENDSSEELDLQQDLDAAEILILLAAPRPMAISVVQQADTPPNGFFCTQCNKMFRCKSNLKQHMMTHTKEKPYPCEVCDKKFSAKSSLKRHMRVHSGEKYFFCKECGKAFMLESSLKSHTKVHEKADKATSDLLSLDQTPDQESTQEERSGE